MSSSDKPSVRIEMHVEAFADSRDETFEVNRAEWESMTPAERAALAQEVTDEFMANHVSAGWHITDPDDYASTSGGERDRG